MARKTKKRVAVPKGRKPKTPAPSPKRETFKEKLTRLKKAGYTELAIPQGATRKTKRGLRERAKEAAIKLIARRDGITIKEATKQHKRALVEIIWAQPTRSAHRKFLEVSPGQWLELQKGKPAKSEYTFGSVRKSPYIQRIQSLNNYWATIHLLAETWDITTEEARRYYSKVIRQFGKKDGLEYVYTDLGLYEEQYGRTTHEPSSGHKPKKRRVTEKTKKKKRKKKGKR